MKMLIHQYGNHRFSVCFDLAINLQSLMLLQKCQVTIFLAITKIATFGILQS